MIRGRGRVARAAAGVVVLVLSTIAVATGPAQAADTTFSGTVTIANAPFAARGISLFATDPGGGTPEFLAAATSASDGSFSLTYAPPAQSDRVLYLIASAGAGADNPSVTLASVLGPTAPASVVINERTTVAAAFGMARFAFGYAIRGPSPGLPNAVGMVHNLVDPVTGQLGTVLDTAPNGAETETRRTFNTLANMVAACVPSDAVCTTFRTLASTPQGVTPSNTFQALVNIARDPWHNATELFSKVASQPPLTNQPARNDAPDAWTLALRFVGDGHSMSGPGNFAVDHDGNLWVANNYQYDRDPFAPVCGSNQLLKFTPDGRYAAGSPYSGGGVSGAGFGVTVDPYGSVWVGNYGFSTPGCTQEPAHDSVSQFTLGGTAVSPAEGYVVGGISWPQGTVSDQKGSIWLANCGNDSVTRIPNGDPTQAQQITGLGLTKPFDIAFTPDGTAFVTGIESSNVAMINADGTPKGAPISGPFDRPMGVTADSTGHVWVDNSAVVDIPCPGVVPPEGRGGSLTLLGPDGTVIGTFTGGGLTIPWGNTVDGNGNVFVANFAGHRLSQFCGVPAKGCRPGTTTGAAITPDSGYGFDGFVRNTGVIVDPSGNVWVTNNWKDIPLQTNPGGYEIVAFVGLGEPVPVAAPQTRPSTTSTTTSTPPPPAPPSAAPAEVVAVNPRFTG